MVFPIGIPMKPPFSYGQISWTPHQIPAGKRAFEAAQEAVDIVHLASVRGTGHRRAPRPLHYLHLFFMVINDG